MQSRTESNIANILNDIKSGLKERNNLGQQFKRWKRLRQLTQSTTIDDKVNAIKTELTRVQMSIDSKIAQISDCIAENPIITAQEFKAIYKLKKNLESRIKSHYSVHQDIVTLKSNIRVSSLFKLENILMKLNTFLATSIENNQTLISVGRNFIRQENTNALNGEYIVQLSFNLTSTERDQAIQTLSTNMPGNKLYIITSTDNTNKNDKLVDVMPILELSKNEDSQEIREITGMRNIELCFHDVTETPRLLTHTEKLHINKISHTDHKTKQSERRAERIDDVISRFHSTSNAVVSRFRSSRANSTIDSTAESKAEVQPRRHGLFHHRTHSYDIAQSNSFLRESESAERQGLKRTTNYRELKDTVPTTRHSLNLKQLMRSDSKISEISDLSDLSDSSDSSDLTPKQGR